MTYHKTHSNTLDLQKEEIVGRAISYDGLAEYIIELAETTTRAALSLGHTNHVLLGREYQDRIRRLRGYRLLLGEDNNLAREDALAVFRVLPDSKRTLVFDRANLTLVVAQELERQRALKEEKGLEHS
jgi:hypothetical protein